MPIKFDYPRQMLQHFGAGWLFWRIRYLAAQKTGVLARRMKAAPWDERPLATFLHNAGMADPETYYAWRLKAPVPFFFLPSDADIFQVFFAQWDRAATAPLREAGEIVRGVMRFFGHTALPTGFPPDWHRNPLTSEKVPPARHWSTINEFDYGDIKTVWEMSRFAFVFPLVRAYWRSRDEVYPEAFWKALENWREVNPPNYGVNWKCGQEISFRVMAWIYGLYGFLSALATTPARVVLLAQMIAASGQRIAGNIDYALSQRNNHGISEATGLWTIGLLFPELRDAEKWKVVGRTHLEREGRRLIYDDGAFSQHSLNYQRLMLHDYLWALRLGDLSGCSFSDELKGRVEQAGLFLHHLQDNITGRAPNYGQNDGTLILPLTNCDYEDFRPVVQSTRLFCSGIRTFEPGPWDEEALWLLGPQALDTTSDIETIADLSAEKGGYYTLRSESGLAFIRCANFKHRPGQADMLHTDIWWRGRNVAVDAGTYSYNAPAPWDNTLARTIYHNTVTVDGRDQMDRTGRFVWLPWLRAWVDFAKKSAAAGLAYWEGQHDGYKRLRDPVIYRRGILRIGPEHWLVIDALASRGAHDYRLHWLLADASYRFDERNGAIILDFEGSPYTIQITGSTSEIKLTLVRGDTLSPRGWVSTHYYNRAPALSLAANVHSARHLFYTMLGPEPASITVENSAVCVEGGQWRCTLQLPTPDGNENRPLVATASLTGSMTDDLSVG